MTDEDRSARPYDVGLQVERTSLAWRRTALEVATVSLVGVRIVPERWGVWGLPPTGLGLVVALVVMIGSHRRYRSQHSALTSTAAAARFADGRFFFVTATLTSMAGIACLLLVIAPVGTAGTSQ